MSKQAKFEVSKYESYLINQIIKRVRIDADAGLYENEKFDWLSLTMDITACHANGCNLKLAELLTADDFDFVHDVFGIRRHINRMTGQLEDCFLPRYAL
jgi:hypothetical protein